MNTVYLYKLRIRTLPIHTHSKCVSAMRSLYQCIHFLCARVNLCVRVVVVYDVAVMVCVSVYIACMCTSKQQFTAARFDVKPPTTNRSNNVDEEKKIEYNHYEAAAAANTHREQFTHTQTSFYSLSSILCPLLHLLLALLSLALCIGTRNRRTVKRAYEQPHTERTASLLSADEREGSLANSFITLVYGSNASE